MPKSFPQPAQEQSDLTRPILGIVEELDREELKLLAAEVILLNRQYLDEAETLFGRISDAQNDGTAATGIADLRRSYRVAMMRSHAFRYVVASVLDALGYVPEIDLRRRTDPGCASWSHHLT